MSVMNMRVQWKLGMCFIKSIEDLNQPHTENHIFIWVDDWTNKIR